MYHLCVNYTRYTRVMTYPNPVLLAEIPCKRTRDHTKVQNLNPYTDPQNRAGTLVYT